MRCTPTIDVVLHNKGKRTKHKVPILQQNKRLKAEKQHDDANPTNPQANQPGQWTEFTTEYLPNTGKVCLNFNAD